MLADSVDSFANSRAFVLFCVRQLRDAFLSPDDATPQQLFDDADSIVLDPAVGVSQELIDPIERVAVREIS